MRWIATLTLFLALAGTTLAGGPDDDYLNIYNQIMQADTLQQNNQLGPAAAKYLEAHNALLKFHDNYPEFNKDAVTYRLEYLGDKVKELAAYMPSTNGAPALAKPVALTPQQQVAVLQEQIRALTNANAEMAMKLKEALSVQPAPAAPEELTKAKEQIDALRRERDLLSVDLEQAKAASKAAPKTSGSKGDAAKLADELSALQKRSAEADKLAKAEIASLNKKLDENEKKLSADAAASKAANSDKPDSDKVKKLKADLDQWKKDLAAAKKEADDREATLRNSDAAELKKAEKERDDLRKQLAAAMPTPPSQRSSGKDGAEVERLRSEVAVLEAKPVPYTPEELAVLNKPGAPASAVAPPSPAKEISNKVHTAKDLGDPQREEMRQAELDVLAGHFEDAEKKCKDVLAQYPNNIYVITKLAGAQLDAGQLDDCDKSVQRGLALDPADAGTLYVLGVLRYRQSKLDDALDALSRSSAVNSTNAGTQYFLGLVLVDKGLRPQAETALRKAVELDPRSADAHFKLSLVLAAETPPFLALAKLHYQKALDLGHEKSDALEKLLSTSQ